MLTCYYFINKCILEWMGKGDLLANLINNFHLSCFRNYYSSVAMCSFLQYFTCTCSAFFLGWESQWKLLCHVNNIHMTVYYFVWLLIPVELRAFWFPLM